MTDIEKFFLDFLKTRTRRQVTTLHFYCEKDKITCLDLSLSAPTCEELTNKVREFLKSYPEREILPAAPEEMWLRFSALSPGHNRKHGLFFLTVGDLSMTVVILKEENASFTYPGR